MINIPDKLAPFKKITIYKLRFKTKPWITNGKGKTYLRKKNSIVIIKSSEISYLH